MSSKNTWICDGIPKDGKKYDYSSGPHEPCENSTDVCWCGLPKEAVILEKVGGSERNIIILLVIAAILLLGVGVGAFFFVNGPGGVGGPGPAPGSTPTPTPTNTIDPKPSPSATGTSRNSSTSQGGEVLLKNTKNSAEKEAGATAFKQKNWNEAFLKFKDAINVEPKDAEARIYMNNARAREAGNSVTMAVGVPISENEDAAQEVLRGVAQAQEEFNNQSQKQEGLLEVVIVDEQTNKASSLARSLISNRNILGVLAQGVDSDNEQAIRLYEKAKLAVVSPLNTRVYKGNSGNGTLETIPSTTKKTELQLTYLERLTERIASYASEKQPQPKFVIFHSDSEYSKKLKEKFEQALKSVDGKVIHDVNITPGVNAISEITKADNRGADAIFLALNKKYVNQAVRIAQANKDLPKKLMLFGTDDLYTPQILIDGDDDDAIAGMVLAVPWLYQEEDKFAQDAKEIWNARVNWRSAGAFITTKVLAEAFSKYPKNREEVARLLNRGVSVPPETVEDLAPFQGKFPLVQAVPGTEGPIDSTYQFDPIKD